MRLDPQDWVGGVTPSIADSPRSTGRASGQPRLLIMDVCGAYMRPLNNWLSTTALIRLMDELGVDVPSTRSAVARMRRRGLLEQERRDGQRGYRLTDQALPLLDEADRRIFANVTPARLEDGWVLVSYSIPESERDKRHVLRSKLSWLGFGTVSSGLWIAPRRMLHDLEHTVRQLEYERYVTIFEGRHTGFEDLRDLVRRCWDLDELRDMYVQFLRVTRPVARRWAGVRRPEGVAAFVDYTVCLYRWRKFPYLDPGLPVELLPAGWEGREAAELFFDLRARLEQAALLHVRDTAARR